MIRGQGDMFRVSSFEKIPFGTKFVLLIPIALLIIERISQLKIHEYLSDVPRLTLFDYQFYRLIFAQFVESQMYNYLFCPLMLYRYLYIHEEKIGTVVFVIDFFFKGILVQIFFILFALLFKDLGTVSNGMWNLVIMFSTLRAFANPKAELQLFGFPCIIYAMYEPPLLIAIKIFAAFLAGFIEGYCFKTMIFRPSKEQVNMLEKSFMFSCFIKRPDFILNQSDSQSGMGELTQPYQWIGKGIPIGTDRHVSQNQVEHHFRDQYEEEEDIL